MGRPSVRGAVVLLYHRPPARLFPDASTVMEHVSAFARHSRYPIYEINVDGGFPAGVGMVEPAAIVLHYSLFAAGRYLLSPQFLEWLDGLRAYKICFFQDEYYFCTKRFHFLNEHRIDCVFTMLEAEHFGEVYGKYTDVPRLEHTLPGYVSEELLAAAARHDMPVHDRTVDVGYRARPLPLYWGRGSQEKTLIGTRFAELAAHTGLKLDIDTSELGRLYGDRWYEFMGACRYVLGVESGVSLFDLEDEVRHEYAGLVAQGREPTLEELERGALGRWDGRIPLRSISPRHFEAAALRTCQILFEGRYSGVMQPMVHYIPLRKDFSNFEEVLAQINDRDLRRELVENAHRDLIASGEWTYARLASQLDHVLADAGIEPEPAPALAAGLAVGARRRDLLRQLRWYPRWLLWVRFKPFFDRIEPLTDWIRRKVGRPRPIPYT